MAHRWCCESSSLGHACLQRTNPHPAVLNQLRVHTLIFQSQLQLDERGCGGTWRVQGLSLPEKESGCYPQKKTWICLVWLEECDFPGWSVKQISLFHRMTVTLPLAFLACHTGGWAVTFSSSKAPWSICMLHSVQYNSQVLLQFCCRTNTLKLSGW